MSIIIIDNDKTQQPIALVDGKPVTDKPQDLFIPPDALQVFLTAFEGPLDLLLYLIRKHKFDILNLPVNKITEQYMEYVDLMKEINLDLAAEYLLMAAILAEIKSRMLLPVETAMEEGEDDPRATLIERLKEYERYKQAAIDIDELPRFERDFYRASASRADNIENSIELSPVTMIEITSAFARVVKNLAAGAHHHIQRESLSTRQRMSEIMTQLNGVDSLPFFVLFDAAQGKAGAIVSLLAVLQLCKEHLIGIAIMPMPEQLTVFKLTMLEESE